MTHLERANEIVEEAIRIRDTYSGCHSLPSTVYDIIQLRKALIKKPESAKSILDCMEYAIAHIRKTVGILKT